MTHRSTVLWLTAASWCTVFFGQESPAAPAGPAFDVASLKIALPPTGPLAGPPIRGGPGAGDPGRFSVRWINLRTLITLAWDVGPAALFGPASLDSAAYDIEAKVPPNTSKEAFRLMFQHLLMERLQLVVHHETRQQNLFELAIAKNGPKLREAEPAAAQPPPATSQALQTVRDKDGNLQLIPGQRGVLLAMAGSRLHLMGRMQGTAEIASALEKRLGSRVIDRTGLTGEYDYTLDFAPDSGISVNGLPVSGETGTGGQNIFQAVIDQLGLKLETRRGPVDVLVVDRFQKVPREN